jgi:hypothetical protein
VAEVAGDPEITGGVFGRGATVIEKTGNELVPVLSLTLITILECVAAVVGVPLRRPVVVLKVAHVGRLVIENVNASPLTSLADGWKAYALPTTTLVLGVPEIVGGVGAGTTVMANAGSETMELPSLTRITMFE